jgi:ParB-like chromosome segregation protein Spo0J
MKPDGTVQAPLMVRRVSLDAIHADPANTNTHDARNLAAIVASLREFGQVEPLVVRKGTGRVIGGNGRLEAMRSIGWSHCDVVEIEASEIKAAGLGIALNRTAKLSAFDEQALLRTLAALQSEPDFPTESTGFSDAEVADLLARLGGPGDDPEPEAEPEAEPDAPVEHVTEKWMVVVECRDEADQVAMIERLMAEGREVKAIVA